MNIGKPVNKSVRDLSRKSLNNPVMNSIYSSITFSLMISMQYTIWKPVDDSINKSIIDYSLYLSIISNTL